MEFNQNWAKHAPILGFSVARKKFEGKDQVNAHAWHDVGQAMANLAVQANALGLEAHQMAGVLPDKIRKNFAIPDEYEPVAVFVVGYPGPPIPFPNPSRAARSRLASAKRFSRLFTDRSGARRRNSRKRKRITRNKRRGKKRAEPHC